MTTHQPYNERLGHPHDFVVEYRFLTEDEGGRQTGPPHQSYRSDFWYEHDNHDMNGIFMIWPEFLDGKGDLIMNTDKKVPETGTARMWIINDQMRKYHQDRVAVGLTGYFMEGSKRVAVCTVTEIEGLMTNPTKENE
jgi:hypothetical protein